jgi:hypothetical protein
MLLASCGFLTKFHYLLLTVGSAHEMVASHMSYDYMNILFIRLITRWNLLIHKLIVLQTHTELHNFTQFISIFSDRTKIAISCIIQITCKGI